MIGEGKGLLRGIDDAGVGARRAVSSFRSGVITDVRTQFKADTNALHVGVHGIDQVASDIEHGKFQKAATDGEHAFGAAVGDEWNGELKSSSDLWNGINQGVHDFGEGAAKGYTEAVNRAAGSIAEFAGKQAANSFRRVALGLGDTVGTQFQFDWGVVEGVHDGAYSAVKGIGTLAGDGAAFQFDGAYRDHLTSEVARDVDFAGKHPLTAYARLGMLEYNSGLVSGGVACRQPRTAILPSISGKESVRSASQSGRRW